ncbi:hypothetical protein [Actinoplanes cyaneus]|uniref:hypothetical protein n=1 Tax=Actinoplanes cyaneus TaxID=52696 RepID=UPI001942C498|nr:hypothetical protein [Actinoplanes cyaneus]
MTATRGTAGRRTRKVVVGLILGFGVGACLWGSVFVYLKALGEGALPSESRIPEVPAGATVVSRDKGCGSGGCWWELLVEPPAGQSPEELERRMGLTGMQHRAPTLFDPGSIYIATDTFQGRLRISVGYD